MRKMIFLAHVSLDGFMAGPNGEMDWITYDEDLEQYVHSLHRTTDAAVYGRATYQMMESYWPMVLADPTSKGGALEHAQWLDNATKIVVSTTLDSFHWNNTVLIRDNVAQQLTKIKEQPGKDLWLIGSPRLAQSLTRLGLIDEYWLNVNPVILGSGMPFAMGMEAVKYLKLLECRTFKGGVVALRYGSVPTKEQQPVAEIGADAHRSAGN